jgi:hypothetical protein
MTDDELKALRQHLPRKLCYGCGEQIGQWENLCPVCGGCPVCGRGSPRGQYQPVKDPGNPVFACVPFACRRCGGCGNCCTCKKTRRTKRGS